MRICTTVLMRANCAGRMTCHLLSLAEEQPKKQEQPKKGENSVHLHRILDQYRASLC